MPKLIVQHRVRDYDAWRPHFDRHESKRLEHGVTNPRVYRNAQDPNDLVVLFNAADEGRAKELGQSDDLRNAMQAAGVEMSTVSVKLLPD
ncbi:MAG: hypothetical protein JO227_23935 [Acetobacteraceae bacterium]|nr:hypothetical protein [Acetobacteraceae bacterium]